MDAALDVAQGTRADGLLRNATGNEGAGSQENSMLFRMLPSDHGEAIVLELVCHGD